MWNDLVFRLRALFQRDAVEAELDDEFCDHFGGHLDLYEE